MASKSKSAAERVAAYERRMRHRGMVKKHVWVPKDRADAVAAIAAALRARKSVDGDVLARAIRAMRDLRPLAERLGIRRAAVFGSVARGDARPDSDLDLLVEFRDASALDLFGYLRARREFAEALSRVVGRVVDVIEVGSVRPEMRERVAEEALYAF